MAGFDFWRALELGNLWEGVGKGLQQHRFLGNRFVLFKRVRDIQVPGHTLGFFGSVEGESWFWEVLKSKFSPLRMSTAWISVSFCYSLKTVQYLVRTRIEPEWGWLCVGGRFNKQGHRSNAYLGPCERKKSPSTPTCQNLKKVYTEASIEFSHLSFKMVSTSPFSLETTPGTSSSGGNDGRTYTLRTRERVRSLQLPGFSLGVS